MRGGALPCTAEGGADVTPNITPSEALSASIIHIDGNRSRRRLRHCVGRKKVAERGRRQRERNKRGQKSPPLPPFVFPSSFIVCTVITASCPCEQHIHTCVRACSRISRDTGRRREEAGSFVFSLLLFSGKSNKSRGRRGEGGRRKGSKEERKADCISSVTLSLMRMSGVPSLLLLPFPPFSPSSVFSPPPHSPISNRSAPS